MVHQLQAAGNQSPSGTGRMGRERGRQVLATRRASERRQVSLVWVGNGISVGQDVAQLVVVDQCTVHAVFSQHQDPLP